MVETVDGLSADEGRFVPLREAARLSPVSYRTLRRRLASGELTRYRRAANRRAVYVDRLELAGLLHPQREPRPEEGGGTA
jgi:hypothetical protein